MSCLPAILPTPPTVCNEVVMTSKYFLISGGDFSFSAAAPGAASAFAQAQLWSRHSFSLSGSSL